jgi:AAA domain/Bifunctional DNA primase/polymerase, N-terminal
MTNTETAPSQRKKSPDALRREHQRALAIRLVTNGVATTPTVDKRTVIKEWPRLDISITANEINKIQDEAKAEGKRRPAHIGSTRRISVVKRLWNVWPDANPCIPCGVNGLFAIDVDIKRNKTTGEITYHGPQLFEAFCKEKGIVIGPDVPKTRSQSGEGYHLIYRNPLGLGSIAGGFAELGCDIRGGSADGSESSGQVVAPGAWRADGKRYVSAEGHADFITAFAEGTIPDLPEAFVKLIGTKPEGAQRSGESKSVSEREVQALADELKQIEDLPDAATLLDPALDGFDMPKIEQRYPKFHEAIRKGNFSDIIFGLSGALKAERADVTAAEYAAVLFEREDCGEFVHDERAVAGVSFNWRSISKSHLKSVPLLSEQSTGEAFGAPVDESEEDDAGVPLEHLSMQENIARKAKREEAEREAEAEAVRLKAEIAELDGAAMKTEAPKTEPKKAEPKIEAPRTKFLRSMDVFKNFVVPEELIEGFLPAVGTVCIVADSNVGKTFFAIYMLDIIMRGEKFFGRNTERGSALMVAGEGRSGLNKRLAALHEVREYDGKGIGISYALPSFSNEASMKVEILKLELLIKEYDKINPDDKTRLVVLDNLIAMVGGDINLSKDTRPLFKALEALSEKLKICIVVIHHTNRNGSTAGSFAIRASCDIMLHITEDKNGVRIVTGDKDRDNAKSHNMKFKLRTVKVGVNKWGSDVTSCVVVPVLSGEAMGAVEEGEEAPPLKVSDDPDDRLNRLIEAARECAEKAAAHREPAEMVPLSPKEIGIVFNTHRERYCGLNGKPLAPLNREGVNRIIARALEAEKLVSRKTKYHLAD